MKDLLWTLGIGMLIACVVLWLAARLLVGRRSVKIRPGFLCMVVGLRRHGKTLFVCRLAHERIKAGIPVYANFTMDGAHKIESWADVCLAPRNACVILDEVSGWAGSRAGQSLRPLVRFYISQCGKLDHEVYIICQHETQVAGEVRDQVNEIIECKRFARGRHRASSYSPHEFRKKNARPLWSWWYTPKDGAAKIYNTKDLVAPARRQTSFDEDYDTIDELIRTINARDRQEAAEQQSVDDWLSMAGSTADIRRWAHHVGKNANGPHPQISTPESATRLVDDADTSA